jgi:hypothetical protein
MTFPRLLQTYVTILHFSTQIHGWDPVGVFSQGHFTEAEYGVTDDELHEALRVLPDILKNRAEIAGRQQLFQIYALIAVHSNHSAHITVDSFLGHVHFGDVYNAMVRSNGGEYCHVASQFLTFTDWTQLIYGYNGPQPTGPPGWLRAPGRRIYRVEG